MVQRKGALELTSLPGKLADCQARDPERWSRQGRRWLAVEQAVDARGDHDPRGLEHHAVMLEVPELDLRLGDSERAGGAPLPDPRSCDQLGYRVTGVITPPAFAGYFRAVRCLAGCSWPAADAETRAPWTHGCMPSYEAAMSGRRLLLAIATLAACDRSSSSPPPSRVDEPVETARAASLAPPVGRGAMSPNLTATRDGALLTWLEPVAAASAQHRLRFARFSHDEWTPPVTIAQGAHVVASWADVPSIVRQDDGTLVAHWAERTALPKPHGYDVVIGRSVDGGTTWQRLGSPHRDGTDTEHGFVSLIPDGDAVLAFWLDGRAMANRQTGATSLRSARIRDTIDEERLIDDRVCDCCSTSTAVTSAGPVVAYRDRSTEEFRDPWLARRTGEAWSEPRPVHADGWRIDGCPVNGPTVVAVEREIAVAWYTRAGDRPSVRIAFSRDAGLTFDRPIEIDAAREDLAPLGRVDVVIDRPGEAVVSWVVSGKSAAHLRVRRVARDGRRGTVLEIATIPAGRDSGVPRMERVGDDVLVAWTDPGGGGVRVSRLALTGVPPVTTAEGQAATPTERSNEH